MERFINEIIAYSRYWPLNKISRDSDNGFILFANQKLNTIYLEVCLRNILSFNDNEWRVIILTSKSNHVETLQVSEFLDKSIEVYVRDKYFSDTLLDLDYYHRHVFLKEFVEDFKLQKYCIVHPDCFILSHQFSNLLKSVDLLNTYSSQHLPQKLLSNHETTGNGGLIVRSTHLLDRGLEIEKERVLKKSIYLFMKKYKLGSLPEFYRYENFIEPELYQYSATTSFVENPYWVHHPQKLGSDWENYLKSRLAPYFKVKSIPILEKFSVNNTVENNCLALVNMENIGKKEETELLPEKQWWFGITSETTFPSKLNPRCLGVLKINEKTPIFTFLEELKDSNRFYQNLFKLLENYYIIGKPYKLLNRYSPVDETVHQKQALYFYNVRERQPPKDSFLRGKKIVLLVDKFANLKDYLYCQPILVVMPYRHSNRDKLQNRIWVNDWSYFGKYNENGHCINCLLLPPYLKVTIDTLEQTVNEYSNHQEAKQNTPFYIKQSQQQIEDGYLPAEIYDFLLKGHPVVTNNNMVIDYFDGRINDYEEFLKKRDQFNSNVWYDTWLKLLNYLKVTRSMEYGTTIILNIVDTLLKTRQDKAKYTVTTETKTIDKISDDNYHDNNYKASSDLRKWNSSIPFHVAPKRAYYKSGIKRMIQSGIRQPELHTGNWQQPRSTSMSVGNWQRSQMINHADKERVVSANYRFGGYNDKIVPQLIVPRKRLSLVSLEQYSLINRTKL